MLNAPKKTSEYFKQAPEHFKCETPIILDFLHSEYIAFGVENESVIANLAEVELMTIYMDLITLSLNHASIDVDLSNLYLSPEKLLLKIEASPIEFKHIFLARVAYCDFFLKKATLENIVIHHSKIYETLKKIKEALLNPNQLIDDGDELTWNRTILFMINLMEQTAHNDSWKQEYQKQINSILQTPKFYQQVETHMPEQEKQKFFNRPDIICLFDNTTVTLQAARNKRWPINYQQQKMLLEQRFYCLIIRDNLFSLTYPQYGTWIEKELYKNSVLCQYATKSNSPIVFSVSELTIQRGLKLFKPLKTKNTQLTAPKNLSFV